MEEDRSALFNQLKNFSQRKLKKVETKVVTASGEQLVEKRGAKGLQVLTGGDGAKGEEAEPPKKLDLQVGLVLPGLLIASQDVAHDKSSLDSYGVTHILNLDSGIDNRFEDDYNYKNIPIDDRNDFDLERVLEDCFDYIDDGRHYGNVLVHCSGTIGLSRSTAVCVAYLMNKEKQKFEEAFNNVKEVRSFVRPNEGFVKQLKEYEVKLRGVQQVKDSGIDDPFALRKKQEIEQEKAMVAGAASVKNRMKMFGATLDTGAPNRSKSVSPSPMKNSDSSASKTPASKWSQPKEPTPAISKSMTPEPRKSWQPSAPAGPPPPPPQMPKSPQANDKSTTSLSSTNAKSSTIASPPPPPPLPGDLSKPAPRPAPAPAEPTSRQTDSDPAGGRQRMVFGRVPPPPMKIKGGLSIEKHDAASDRNSGLTKTTARSSGKTSSLQLPLKKQNTSDSDGDIQRAPSPQAALRAAKQQVAARQSGAADDKPPASAEHRQSVSGQLNRSSTKKLLNLIKTKTKTDLTLPDGDENDEIEALLGALESESIDNIDWDELGLDEDEVKDIIQQGGSNCSDASSSSSSSDEDDDEDEEEEIEEEMETQHFVIRTK